MSTQAQEEGTTPAKRVVAFDTETRGLAWHDPNCRAFLGSWADADGEYVADLSTADGAAPFLAALYGADVLVAHNFSFDAHHVREALGLDVLKLHGKVFEDTDLISRVLHPEGQRAGERGGHGLKNLAKVYLRADAGNAEEEIERMAKSIGVKLKGGDGAYYDVWRAYPDPMEHYAKLDARFTYDLYTRFSKELDGRLGECYALERDVMPIIIRTEQRGIKLDQDRVLELKGQYEARRDALHDILAAELGDEALGGLGSEAALLEALQGLGVPLHKRTKTGQISTDKFALEEFTKDFPVIGRLQEFRQMEKFLATYIGPMVGKDTLHPSFWQCGAWTGRMSCSNPNLQNIPVRAGSEVRSVFVPRPGYSFVVCDYDSIEIRLLAYYMGNEDYRELVAHNDPHAWMASNIWGGDAADFAKDGPNAGKRALAKNVLFAICYGAGAPRVAAMLADAGVPDEAELERVKEQLRRRIAAANNCRPEDLSAESVTDDDTRRVIAKDLIAKIKKSLPGFFRLNKRIRDKIETVGYVETLFGRKQIVKPEKSYVGMNALIQGSAADVFKAGVVAVDRAVREHGAHPILFVHDEIVLEVPTHQADIVKALTIEAMESVAPQVVPALKVTGTVAHGSYAEAK